MMQALAELSVVYPINGAFTMYICRFVDPSLGFACAWEYAISWLTVLPFEISAACNIIHYWPGSDGVNNSAWIIPLLVALVAIQFFGVRGYGEVDCLESLLRHELILVGGICSQLNEDRRLPRLHASWNYYQLRWRSNRHQGLYWCQILVITHWWCLLTRLTFQNRHSPYTAFLNGFHGFCSVFVTAAFAYTGTELTGLAAAETTNPKKEIPRASKQVVWRIAIFYIVNLFLIGLIVPEDSPLYSGEGSESRHSPFVIAIQLAGIKALPSIFNAVILISVMSVANSCTFGSTRTIQALAANGGSAVPRSFYNANFSLQVWLQNSWLTSTRKAALCRWSFSSFFSDAWRLSTWRRTAERFSLGFCHCLVFLSCSSTAVSL